MHFLTNYLDFGSFIQNSFDDNKDGKEQESDYDTIWVTKQGRGNPKPYTYAEAINLTGHGRYSIGLLALNTLALLGMSIDMFGFTVVISNSACDLELGTNEKNILLSIPFIGSILSSYWWGYISDTRGRKISLHIAMWGSSIAATLCAFSPDWITLAVLKLISVSFCSCAQSVAYTWIGESCAENVKSIYYILLNCSYSFSFSYYIILSYITSTLDFSIDLYFINFVPWRLLSLALTVPLGVCALSCHYFYESPKFLVNIGDEKLALDILKKIWIKNRCLGKIYPVQKVAIGEEGNINTRNEPILKSLWGQTVPLFKMPLLLRTFQLFYLIITIYIACNSFYIWFPFITNALLNNISSGSDTVQGLCDIIGHSKTNVSVSEMPCESKINPIVVGTSIVQGLCLFLVNLSFLKLASRRKLLLIVFLSISSVAAAGAGASTILGLSVGLFFVVPIAMCAIGLVFSYFVDLYPTSYCGMASCLGALVSRLCGLFSVNVVGIFIISECSTTLYLIAANLLGGVIVTFFLPPDKPNETKP